MNETLIQPGPRMVIRRDSTAIAVDTVAANGGSETIDVTGWFGEGVILHLRLAAQSATLRTTVELFGRDTLASEDRMYRAVDVDAHTSTYEDRVPFWYRDLDQSGELHVKITNNGTVASAYTLEAVGMGV